MPVLDTGGGERPGQGLDIELRVAARARDAAHIHQALDAGPLQQRDEFLDCVDRMTDGEDRAGGPRLPFRRRGGRGARARHAPWRWSPLPFPASRRWNAWLNRGATGMDRAIRLRL